MTMLYLSRLMLNARSRLVQRECSNRYELHKSIYHGFPGVLPDDERLLFRLDIGRDGQIVVLVQSKVEPAWEQNDRMQRHGYLLRSAEVKPFAPQFANEQRFIFRLVANPTVKRQGKRLALRREDEQIGWMQRKAAEHGFALLDMRLGESGDVYGSTTTQRMTWHGVIFEGVLSVIDPQIFAETIEGGIGSAKSFGFGLLSVARIAEL